VIGKKGEDIEARAGKCRAMTRRAGAHRVEEIRKPELDAQLVAESVAQQLEAPESCSGAP